MGYGGVPGNGEVNLPQTETTIAQELKTYGYRTVNLDALPKVKVKCSTLK